MVAGKSPFHVPRGRSGGGGGGGGWRGRNGKGGEDLLSMAVKEGGAKSRRGGGFLSDSRALKSPQLLFV